VLGTICVFDSPLVNSNAVPSVTSPVVVRPSPLLLVLELSAEKKSDSEREPGTLDVREPALKNSSSLTLRARFLIFPVGGGVTRTSPPNLGPLLTVTGLPPPTPSIPPLSELKLSLTKLKPKPRPGLAERARDTALANSSSRSVRDDVRRKDEDRDGAMTRGSEG
jgi:hypothetical protein